MQREVVGLIFTQVAKSPHCWRQFVVELQSPPQTCVSLGSGFSEAAAVWKAAVHSRTARTVANIFNMLFMEHLGLSRADELRPQRTGSRARTAASA